MERGTSSIRRHHGRFVVLEEAPTGRTLRAYDPELQREVAIEEVPFEETSGRTAARSIEEARAMAKLSHPNVVQVYDVEELANGRLLLIKEVVDGPTLEEWLALQPRGWREIVSCFVSAGRGLVAAHRAGVFHGDFTPKNVIVGGDGTLKVTGFRVGRMHSSMLNITHQSSEEEKDPEWITFDSAPGLVNAIEPPSDHEDLDDGKVDQRAFCLALWDALSGRQTNSPSRLSPGPTRVDIPRAIVRALRSSLAPKTPERAPNLESLIDLLSAESSVRPLRARHVLIPLVLLGVAGALWMNLFAGSGPCASGSDHLGSTWNDERRTSLRRAMLSVERPFARTAALMTEQTLDRHAERWVDAFERNCRLTLVHEVQSAEVMALRAQCLERVRIQLDAVTRLMTRADARLVEHAHEVLEELEPVESCDDVAQLQARAERPPPAEEELIHDIRELLAEGGAERKAAHFDQARKKYERARELVEKVTFEPIRAESSLHMGSLFSQTADHDLAERWLRQALVSAARSGRLDLVQRAASALLFVVGNQKAQFEQALLYRELALDSTMADARTEGTARLHLAVVQVAAGRLGQAEVEARHAVRLLEAELGSDHPSVANALNNLAEILRMKGEHSQALDIHEQALSSRLRTLGPDHPETARSHENLGNVLAEFERYDEAEHHYRRAFAIRRETLPPVHSDWASLHHNFGTMLLQRGADLEHAERELRSAIDIGSEVSDPEHPQVLQSMSSLGDLLALTGRPDEAIEQYRLCVERGTRSLGPAHPQRIRHLRRLAELSLDQGRTDEALEVAQAAWELASSGEPSEQRARVAFALARALRLVDPGPSARARAFALSALEDLQRDPAAPEDVVDAIEGWLDEHGTEHDRRREPGSEPDAR